MRIVSSEAEESDHIKLRDVGLWLAACLVLSVMWVKRRIKKLLRVLS